MTVRVDDIRSADWSPRLRDFGEVVVELADIGQCIGIILTTRRGEDSHRPLFGCDAWKYLDAPLAVARPQIIREVLDALELWEPRITVTSVTVGSDGATLTIRVEWITVADAAVSATEVSL